MVYRKVTDMRAQKPAECPECKSTRLMLKGGKLSCTNCGHSIGEYNTNKFGAKKSEYNGVKYHSKFEANCAVVLDTRLKANEIKEVQRQVKVDLRAYGQHITNYFIDFIVIHHDGHKEYIEAKGAETDVWKMKFKMLEAKLESEEPGAELTLWKQNVYKKVR